MRWPQQLGLVLKLIAIWALNAFTTGDVSYQQSCDFSQGLCSAFVNVYLTDNRQWRVANSTTPPANSGPSGDPNGNGGYVYFGAADQTDSALLQMPPLRASGSSCVEFYCYMSGSTVGSLAVLANNQTIANITGDQGAQWIPKKVPIATVGNVTVAFLATKGTTNDNVVALDSIKYSDTPCNSEATSTVATTAPCTENPCLNGATCIPLPTPNPVTCRCPPGYNGEHCEIVVPCDPIFNPCQNGATCWASGSTAVCTCPADWTGVNCTQCATCSCTVCSSDATCVQTSDNVTCQPIPSTTTTNVPRPGICSSSICLNGGICQRSTAYSFTCRCPEPFVGQFCERSVMHDVQSTCTFDNPGNVWCGYYNAWFDDYDWIQQRSSPNYPYTGPSADHNAPSIGTYLTTKNCDHSAGQKAILFSPYIPSGRRCITFWYYMYGDGVGSLRVFARGTMETLLQINGNQGNFWQRAYVPWNGAVNQFGFEATVGTTSFGNIAIDDLTIYWGYCWTNTPNPVTFKPLPQGYSRPPTACS